MCVWEGGADCRGQCSAARTAPGASVHSLQPGRGSRRIGKAPTNYFRSWNLETTQLALVVGRRRHWWQCLDQTPSTYCTPRYIGTSSPVGNVRPVLSGQRPVTGLGVGDPHYRKIKEQDRYYGQFWAPSFDPSVLVRTRCSG